MGMVTEKMLGSRYRKARSTIENSAPRETRIFTRFEMESSRRMKVNSSSPTPVGGTSSRMTYRSSNVGRSCAQGFTSAS